MTVVAHTNAIRVGDTVYVMLATIVALATSLAAIVELVRTRCWYGLPEFDYRDIQDVIIASWIGSGASEDTVRCVRDANARFALEKRICGDALFPIVPVTLDAESRARCCG